ncbi:MAG: hypothetical protein K1X85_10340 [Ignavibacteria bacterium]|nr:hypothetical protein [Ignavibacteria bacterium]
MKSILAIAGLMLYLPLVLNPECPGNYGPVSPLSGSWNFTFSYGNGKVFANSVVQIGLNGSICGKIKVSDTGETFYVTGEAGYEYDSDFSGRFSDACGNLGYVTSEFKGTLSEMLGAGYGSGSFSFTQKNPGYKGTWQAKRN